MEISCFAEHEEGWLVGLGRWERNRGKCHRRVWKLLVFPNDIAGCRFYVALRGFSGFTFISYKIVLYLLSYVARDQMQACKSF